MNPTNRRVRILIDFWNFQLAWNTFNSPKRPRIHWQGLPDVLVPLVSAEGDGMYHGCYVYASVGQSEKDEKLRRFLEIMASFPGYNVVVKDRKQRYSEPCPNCHTPIKRTVEKGVDTALVTDLIQAAVDNLFDDAILISGDADFVPAVELIQNRTTARVIHAYFKHQGHELRKSCWSHVILDADTVGSLTDRSRPAIS